MNIPFVDLTRQYNTLKPEVDRAIGSVLTRGDFILGKEVTEFEDELARFFGVDCAVTCASGTDAIYLILRALGIGPGDEIITQANTFIATVLPIMQLGAKPVLVDVLEQTGAIDASLIKKAITKRTRAIFPVHLFGFPVPIKNLRIYESRNLPAGEAGLRIIEDAAQAIGSKIGKNMAGSMGRAAALSFYPGKNLGGYGDGGSVLTNDKKLARTVRIIANIGQTKKYHHLMPGINSRLDTLQAAILLAKFPHITQWNKKRDILARRYIRNLGNVGDVILPPIPPKNVVTNWHLFVVRTKKRDALKKYLEKRGIHCGIHYPIPLHLQPALEILGYRRGDFPITEKLAHTSLSLPMFPELTLPEQDYVITTIKQFFK